MTTLTLTSAAVTLLVASLIRLTETDGQAARRAVDGTTAQAVVEAPVIVETPVIASSRPLNALVAPPAAVAPSLVVEHPPLVGDEKAKVVTEEKSTAQPPPTRPGPARVAATSKASPRQAARAASSSARETRKGAVTAAREPAATAEGGSLVVITEPDGARVTINGVGYGTTPLTIPYLPPGTKRVRVTKAGFATEERVVSADAASAAAALRIDLREAGGREPQ